MDLRIYRTWIIIRSTLAVLFLSLLFADPIPAWRSEGENYVHVYMGGQILGVTGSRARAESLAQRARKAVAQRAWEQSPGQLYYSPVEFSYAGEEVWFGSIDRDGDLQKAMEAAIEGSGAGERQRAYTVKVGEYTVTLAGISEVEALLQAALDKFGPGAGFYPVLSKDTQRQMQALHATVEGGQDRVAERAGLPEGWQTGDAYLDGGVEAWFRRMSLVEPDPSLKAFSDYPLGVLDMDFADKVEVVEVYLPEAYRTPLDTAIEQLTKEQEKVAIYEVVAGDTLSEIAIKVNIPMDVIISLNENLENENSTIRVGDELIIMEPEPELSVERVEEEYIEETFDAPVEYIENDSWYTTEMVVHRQPSAGFRKAIAISRYLDSKLLEEEILKEEVVVAPVAKLVERGTKIPPTYIKPLSGGRFTSGFGPRKAPKRGASSYHRGVDWATPTGTAIFASSGGTVAKAGWGGGYGYVVYINHADGRQTRYAHLSKVLVKAGDTVKQGAKIALSGNTGVSTGPHLHFEMLIGGSHVNPLKYLN